MPSEDDNDTLFDLAEFTSPPPGSSDPRGGIVGAPQTIADALASVEALDLPELDDRLGREIHSLAHAIRKAEPWQRLEEDDWFGIRDPRSGDVMVVSIMGMAEENFAVQLYLPEEGLRFWNHLLDTGTFDHSMLPSGLRMIECEFASKEDLQDFDLAAHEHFRPVKNTGRARIAYTLFRSYRPGYFPWPIETGEAELIAIALRLVPRFDRFIDAHYNEFYHDAGTNRPLIPLFSLKAGGDRSEAGDWEISSCPFPEARPERLPELPRDDLFVPRLAGFDLLAGGEAWECGIFLMSDSVQHEGRIVFPSVALTHAGAATVVPPALGMPGDSKVTLIRRSFCDAVEAAGALPRVLHYCDPLVEFALHEFAGMRGIKLREVDGLPNLDELVDAISGTQRNLDTELLQRLEALLGPDFQDRLPSEFLQELQHAPPEAIEEFLDKLSPVLSRMFGGPPVPADASEEPELEYRKPTARDRIILRIDLVGAKPPIWRRISMPADASLFDLHCAIQDAMGWEDEHLHAFALSKSKGRPQGLDWEDEISTTLEQIARKKSKKLLYNYDFGDNWEHSITFEKKIAPEAGKRRSAKPELITGKGLCPYEDCGGIWGWQALLRGQHHFTEDWEEDELERFKKEKFDPKSVKFYPVASRAAEFVSRQRRL